ncbi:hypothetical protein R3P38DRAFT_2977509 [Favolaschia claudopus]|uniref:Cupredoxin n=1 Tax=Favolaschia claudopus TaxID=2862362 RepID=A0AAW0B433_9AGAR
MRFSLAVAALAPVLSVYAEEILVTVGAGGLLAFNPTNVTAKVGDTISFQFQSKNHSVTQSTFAQPCQIQTTPAQGIDSDYQPVANTSTTFPQWSFTLDNDTTPLWFFCKQTNPAPHCQKGMVFSVNAKPDGPKSFAVYQAAAMGDPAAVEAAAAASASAAGGAGGAAGPSDSAGGAAQTGGSGGAPGGAAQTDGAGAISGLTGAGSPTGPAGPGNSNTPNSGFRVGGSAASLVAVAGLSLFLL